ncbi:hypothetical protein JS530_03340 [Bifidobacterium sp. LC6]|uniref:Uncharacterized protein n=1 Tax=Bifidobacterium colobi TaxID=2809026 RepID=A0ABS5UU45_9BIFI|nr:hypothetical protein [Bifidobacterium colobi]MBT1174552.1 hypothetical protein [Bifidobacterium colobi]
MADNNDDSFNNDLQFGPITVDVPDDLDDIKRDLKFYKNVGEFIDTKQAGKLADVLGQKVGLTNTSAVTKEVLKQFNYERNAVGKMKHLDSFPLGQVSQRIKSATDELDISIEKSALKNAAHNLSSKISTGVSRARMALTAVDLVSKYIFGVSIVDEWLKKPFFGDWDELEETAGKWDAMAASLSTVQAAIQEISANVNETSWAGAAADMFVERNNAAAEVVGDGCQPCSEMSQALNALAQNAQDAFDLVLDTIDEIISLLKLIAGELIIPGAGPILATVTAAAEIAQAIQWGIEIVNCLNNLYTAFMGFANCISVMQTLVGKSEGVKMSFGTGSSSSGNGSGGSGGGSFGGR